MKRTNQFIKLIPFHHNFCNFRLEGMQKLFTRYKLLLVLIFSVLFTTFFFVQLLFEYSINLPASDIIGALLVFIYCLGIGLIHVYYNSVLKFNFSKKIYHYLIKFLVTSIFAFLLTAVCNFLKVTFSYSIVDESVNRIVIARGLMLNLCFFFIIALMEAIGSMRQYEMEISELKRSNQEAQLQQLKNQISPHFFFNSLNTLKSMIEDNDKDSVDFILKLSFIYRQFLKDHDKPLATLKEELDFASAYFSVLNARFEGALNVNYSLQDKFMQHKIPVFALQVIIENIIKHNKISSQKPIDILISTNETSSSLSIRNTIITKSKIEESNKIGLNNIRSRYMLLGVDTFNYHSDSSNFIVELPLLANV